MILSPTQLAQALQTTNLTIKILDSKGSRIDEVTPSEAALLIRKATYVAKGTLRRVKQLWEVPEERPFVIEPEYWDGRGVFRFWSDQRSAGGHSRAA